MDSTWIDINYRIGDYVYFDSNSSDPYQIRRIEEIRKTAKGEVLVKVLCLYRKSDIQDGLVLDADPIYIKNVDFYSLSAKQRNDLKYRELYLSRRIETISATRIKGKCTVVLLSEIESLLGYLNRKDAFFYCLIYDTEDNELYQDERFIRVGSEYQAVVPSSLEQTQIENGKKEFEKLLWTPNNSLTDDEINKFVERTRYTGTVARALQCCDSRHDQDLISCATAASRDTTIFYAMDTLHNNRYIFNDAINSLDGSSIPSNSIDEMERWTTHEAEFFIAGLQKHGKDFGKIRNEFLPWKSFKNIIDYYYMWKTTDKYVLFNKDKIVNSSTKLKSIRICHPESKILNSNSQSHTKAILSCDACEVQDVLYSVRDSNSVEIELCKQCWLYWKKYGCF